MHDCERVRVSEGFGTGCAIEGREWHGMDGSGVEVREVVEVRERREEKRGWLGVGQSTQGEKEGESDL